MGGREAVEYALDVLQQFYEQYALSQTGAKYVPPDSDREGQTVGDRAPEIFDSEYKGAQKDSKGIIGLLNVMLSDFERTGNTVSENEDAAQTEYEAYKKETEDNID